MVGHSRQASRCAQPPGLLRRYEVRSKQMRGTVRNDEGKYVERAGKGYFRDSFIDAWNRYVPDPETGVA